jgi:hypothetical protein
MDAREERIGRIVTAVIAEAVRVTGRAGIVVACDGSPEARLLTSWCRAFLSVPVRTRETGDDESGHSEFLAAHPANKTALLLGRNFPLEPLLPLGDLYASQVKELTGGYNLPDQVQSLAEAAGGINALDAALQLRFESWLPAEQAAEPLPKAARGPFLEAVRAGRFWRERAGLIPKLSARTIGIDLLG